VWRRFSRFQAVGALGVGLQLSLVALLIEAGGLGYLSATLIAVGAAIVHNFGWHHRWTWRGRAAGLPAVATAFGRFVLANGAVSIAGHVLVTTALAGGARVPPVAANAVAIALCGLVNFWLGERVVFPARRNPIAPPVRSP
jgi:putative flippase GtrA